jgi:hypothetical protein
MCTLQCGSRALPEDYNDTLSTMIGIQFVCETEYEGTHVSFYVKNIRATEMASANMIECIRRVNTAKCDQVCANKTSIGETVLLEVANGTNTFVPINDNMTEVTTAHSMIQAYLVFIDRYCR